MEAADSSWQQFAIHVSYPSETFSNLNVIPPSSGVSQLVSSFEVWTKILYEVVASSTHATCHSNNKLTDTTLQRDWYCLQDRGSISRRSRDVSSYSQVSRQSLWHTQPSAQQVPKALPGHNRPEREANYPPPSSAEVRMLGPPICISLNH